ncbi:hypothetical protein HY008_02360 [Candidatus Woesebacteria bacterium]|nr:hypothetical protein [Candidatus Woesebacteria bacterium]
MTKEETEKFLNEDFAPGAGTAAVDYDRNSNTLLLLHSGRNVATNEPLEAEDTRAYLEGEGSRELTEETKDRMRGLRGAIVTLVDEDGNEKEFKIEAVGYVPHDRKPEYDASPDTALDTVIDVTGKGGSRFGRFKEKRGIIASFCGQGPRNEPNWWVWSRYVLGLQPVK